MEITGVEPIPLESPVDTVQMKTGDREQAVAVLPVLVKVHTDGALTGLGETLTYDPTGAEAEFTAQGVRALSRHLVGKNPLDVADRWRELYQHTKRATAFKSLSAIDEALWDITAKDAGKPCSSCSAGALARWPHTPRSPTANRPRS